MDQENIPVAEPVKPPTGNHHEVASGRAIATLILGILSLLCTGFLTGIPAIILGNMELKDIKAGKSSKQSEGIARVGFILGIIGTALTCIITLIIALFFFLAVTFGGFDAMRNSIGSV